MVFVLYVYVFNPRQATHQSKHQSNIGVLSKKITKYHPHALHIRKWCQEFLPFQVQTQGKSLGVYIDLGKG